jgi:hypothetical protein
VLSIYSFSSPPPRQPRSDTTPYNTQTPSAWASLLIFLYIVLAYCSCLHPQPCRHCLLLTTTEPRVDRRVCRVRHDSHEHCDSHQQRHAVWETLAASASHCPAHQGLCSPIAARFESPEIPQLGSYFTPHSSSAAITHGLLVSELLLCYLSIFVVRLTRVTGHVGYAFYRPTLHFPYLWFRVSSLLTEHVVGHYTESERYF